MSIDADMLASSAGFEKTVEPELKNQRGRRDFAGFSVTIKFYTDFTCTISLFSQIIFFVKKCLL